jgi:hypothetical protein
VRKHRRSRQERAAGLGPCHGRMDARKSDGCPEGEGQLEDLPGNLVS